MPGDYTGTGSAIPPRAASVITCPVDGDPRTAESVNVPLRKLTDITTFFQTNAALLGLSRPNNDALVVNGQDNDLIACLKSDCTSGKRKYLWEIDPHASAGKKTRLYLNANRELEVTNNCYWNNATWQTDTGTGARRFTFGESGIIYQICNSLNQWPDSAWPIAISLSEYGIAWAGSENGQPNPANPSHSSGCYNLICAKNICKAWAYIAWDANSKYPVCKDGLNIKSVNPAGMNVTSRIIIQFASGFSSTDYAPVVNPTVNIGFIDTPFIVVPTIVEQTQYSVTVDIFAIDGTGKMARRGMDETPNVALSFHAFGQQN